jgi:hypothetical protein
MIGKTKKGTTPQPSAIWPFGWIVVSRGGEPRLAAPVSSEEQK